MQKPSRGEYAVVEFLDWSEARTLVVTPKFQRRAVWQRAAKSFFIDTLLRQMPVPPIYLRLAQAEEKNRVVREVIDGQQRITAVLEYLRGEFALSKSLPAAWRGKGYEQLAPAEQERIRNYSFAIETFSGLSDQDVLEMFSRLNTYSVPLNAQELRNGRYFGKFKQLAYTLAYEYLEFWRQHRVFTERGIARMEEVELVSELIIASMAGMQDKKNSIDDFYAEYDEDFSGASTQKSRFDRVMDVINTAFPEGLSETEFHRPPLFYTLYLAAYHRLFGLPKATRPRKPGALRQSEVDRLSKAVMSLSTAIESFRQDEDVSPALAGFVAASQRQTDNLKPRQTRFNALYTRAFL
jgi:hypothetical protein